MKYFCIIFFFLFNVALCAAPSGDIALELSKMSGFSTTYWAENGEPVAYIYIESVSLETPKKIMNFEFAAYRVFAIKGAKIELNTDNFSEAQRESLRNSKPFKFPVIIRGLRLDIAGKALNASIMADSATFQNSDKTLRLKNVKVLQEGAAECAYESLNIFIDEVSKKLVLNFPNKKLEL